MSRSREGAVLLSRAAHVRGVEVLEVEGTSERYGMFHERFAISLCRGAQATIRHRGRTQTIPHEHAVLFQPGECHQTVGASGPLSFAVLFIDGGALMDAVGSSVAPRWSRSVLGVPGLIRAHRELCLAVRRLDEPLALQCAFASFVGALVDAARGADSPAVARARPWVRRVCEMMQDRFDDGWPLDELARELGGITTFHLLRVFRAEVGLTPHQFLIHVRIARARDRLRAGVPAAAVAQDVGFGDQSHFHRHFRRIVGVTPGAYARATAAKRARTGSTVAGDVRRVASIGAFDGGRAGGS